jgi:hypothetical protein
MMRFAAVAVMLGGLAGLVGCAGAPARSAAPIDRPTRDDESRQTRQYNELEDDILSSYERDEPPELATGTIDPRIGSIRIGAGPDDVHLSSDRGRAPGRLPLGIDRSIRTEVRSKHLELTIALDQTAAWMSDELSWRIDTCGRTAVIPLRITALYARDGDRWVTVFEHLSFGRSPAPGEGVAPRAIKTEVVSGDLRDELSGVIARGLFREPHDPTVAAQSGGALVLGPDAGDEWHGARVLTAQLPGGTLEDRRVGLVGRNPATATLAYWVGNYNATVPARPGAAAGKARLRVSHVFEKRWFDTRDQPTEGKSCGLDDNQARDPERRKAVEDHCRWMLVQSHMSQPIQDEALIGLVFGTAPTSSTPLQFDCSTVGR